MSNELLSQILFTDVLGPRLLARAMEDSQVRMYMMLFGLAAFSGGILLMIRHKRAVDEVFRTVRDRRIQIFEQRKFRRRATGSALISAIGVMLTSLYWANEPVPFTILISMILILLVALLGIAILDLMSLGLQSIAHPDGFSTAENGRRVSAPAKENGRGKRTDRPRLAPAKLCRSLKSTP